MKCMSIMCRKRQLKKSRSMMRPRLRRQRGFAIVTAIFLLVVLSALGAFMVTMSTTQNVTAAQDIQGSKAYQAARTGAEWGAYQILQRNGDAFALACQVGPTTQSLPPLGGMLAGFTVSVNCVANPYTEGANSLWVYQLTSTATMGVLGSTGYVDRQVRISVEN